MNTKKIGKRTVVVQPRRKRGEYRAVAWELMQVHATHPAADAVHGFVAGRSALTNAQAHADPRARFILVADFADCFGHVDIRRLQPHLSGELASKVPRAGTICAQGYTTSPAAANIVLADFDAELLTWVAAYRAAGGHMTYTRYADDLTITCDALAPLRALRQLLPTLAAEVGQELNPSKVHLRNLTWGRAEITGLHLDAAGTVHVSRRTRRRLRQLRHAERLARRLLDSAARAAQAIELRDMYSAAGWLRAVRQHFRHARNARRGLEEWCRMRQPSGRRVGRCEAAWLARHAAKHLA